MAGCAGTVERASGSAVIREAAPLLSAGLSVGRVVFAFSRNGSGLLLAKVSPRAKPTVLRATRERVGAVSAGTDAFSATAAKDEEEVIPALFCKLMETGWAPLPAA